MLIATCCIGDSLVTLTKPVPLRAKGVTSAEFADEVMTADFYNLTFTDLPTDKRVTVVICGENDAMLAFAAWIAADEPPGFPNVERMRQVLRTGPAKNELP